MARDDINQDILWSDLKACTTYTVHLRMFYFIEEADLQINEERFFSEDSPCPGLNYRIYFYSNFLPGFFSSFRTRGGNCITSIRPGDMFFSISYWSFYLFREIFPCQQIFCFIPSVSMYRRTKNFYNKKTLTFIKVKRVTNLSIFS